MLGSEEVTSAKLEMVFFRMSPRTSMKIAGVVFTSSSAAAERPREPLSHEKSHLTRRIALSCGIKMSPVGSLD